MPALLTPFPTPPLAEPSAATPRRTELPILDAAVPVQIPPGPPQLPECPTTENAPAPTLRTPAPFVAELPVTWAITPAVPSSPVAAAEPDFTDADLREAISPLLAEAPQPAPPLDLTSEKHLQPMLRAAVRRALAESAAGVRPVPPPGAFAKLRWRLQAFFTGRPYREVFFEKTHRFQVGEVFLVDAATHRLVSFASCDPAHHNSPQLVEAAVQRLIAQLREPSGELRRTFELPEQRHIFSSPGHFVTILAVVRGRPSDSVVADLEFALLRIEDRFREQLRHPGSPILPALQPFLEDCLLIQAPADSGIAV